LRGERVARFHGTLAGGLAGGRQLAAGTPGERLHADRGEHVVGGAQLCAGVGPAALAAQPLPVEQVPAREFYAEARTSEARDRLAVLALGGVRFA